MKWFRIDKSGTDQPQAGKYSDWKRLLEIEARGQCVYCAIHEANFGGVRNFHVEHYRPQKHFPALTNVIANLFFACSICNSFKGHQWPGEPDKDLNTCCFPDPSANDFSDFLELDNSQVVYSRKRAGSYLIHRLNLNRNQLILVRRLVRIRSRLRALVVQNEGNVDPRVAGIIAKIAAHALNVDRLVPYTAADAQRA